jgi:mannitol/fructose-specific phosphotransferase system IIA component (Ntr-type)
MKLSEIIRPEAIVTELSGTDRETVVCELVDALEDAGCVNATHREELLLMLLKREAVASTALGGGVAIPHAKVRFVSDFCGAVGISRNGIDFAAQDRKKVTVVFLFLSPEQAISGHLQLMAHIAGISRNKKYLNALRNARLAREVRELIAAAETMLFREPGDPAL